MGNCIFNAILTQEIFFGIGVTVILHESFISQYLCISHCVLDGTTVIRDTQTFGALILRDEETCKSVKVFMIKVD